MLSYLETILRKSNEIYFMLSACLQYKKIETKTYTIYTKTYTWYDAKERIISSGKVKFMRICENGLLIYSLV